MRREKVDWTPWPWSSKFVNLSLSYLLFLVFCYVILLWWLLKKKREKLTYGFFFRAHFDFLCVVSDYNFVQDSNLFSKTNMLLKGTTTSTPRKFYRSKHNKRFFWKRKKNVYLEDENNEGLSQIPKWTWMFSNGLDKRTIVETLI